MATRSDLQGPFEGFDWKLFCQMPSCPYNTDGIKISSWWLFLCICYLSCFLIGIIFTVNGFASMGNEMAAVGLGLVIVGASLAIVCDVLRRLGVGWTKIVPESPYPSRQFVHTSGEFGFPIPFLPGYPGFCSGGEETRCDSPPPYVNSPHGTTRLLLLVLMRANPKGMIQFVIILQLDTLQLQRHHVVTRA